jgi:hypothetical protein
VVDAAKSMWGDGDYNLYTNMDEYPDAPGNLCTSNTAAVMEFSG